MANDDCKKNAATYAADLVKKGMIVGLGSGSTVSWLIQELGARLRTGLEIRAVPTSKETERLARKQRIKLVDLNSISEIALTIDGADEITADGTLIKGGGGALLQEKMVAAASRKLVIIADHSKMVKTLGRFPLPVEVVPFGFKQVSKYIRANTSCKKVTLRKKQSRPFITDHGHYILDCHFGKITDAKKLNDLLHQMPGVVETGLFIGMASGVITGEADGSIREMSFSIPR